MSSLNALVSDTSVEAMRVRMARFSLVLSVQASLSLLLLRSVMPLVPDADGTAWTLLVRLLPFGSLAIPAVPAFLLYPWCFPVRPYDPHLAHELREIAYRTERFALVTLRDPRSSWRKAISIRWWCGVRAIRVAS